MNTETRTVRVTIFKKLRNFIRKMRDKHRDALKDNYYLQQRLREQTERAEDFERRLSAIVSTSGRYDVVSNQLTFCIGINKSMLEGRDRFGGVWEEAKRQLEMRFRETISESRGLPEYRRRP